MFQTYPNYSTYRTLFLTAPAMQGEDVYALQTALNELNFDAGAVDGVLGRQTYAAIRKAQQEFKISVDGKAGGATQKALAMGIAERVASQVKVPVEAFRGQMALESGYRLGIYSPARVDGTYDAGVAQRNTRFTPPKEGFDCQASILALGKNTREHFDLFVGLEGKRRWALAQGAWNAPAFACFLAREEGATKVTAGMTARPWPEARQTFENYVLQVSVYLTV